MLVDQGIAARQTAIRAAAMRIIGLVPKRATKRLVNISGNSEPRPARPMVVPQVTRLASTCFTNSGIRGTITVLEKPCTKNMMISARWADFNRAADKAAN